MIQPSFESSSLLSKPDIRKNDGIHPYANYTSK
jgi:hypothetical protein